jgi:tetratricopeptide (TPR) repeat protein
MGPGAGVPEPERIARAYQLAKRAARADDAADAERLYREAVATYAEFAPAWNNLGVSLMLQERYLEAAEAFDRAAELAPADPRPPYNRGLLWFRRAYPREALPFFLVALERDPNYLPALRAAVQTEIRLRESSTATLDRIQRALLLETDPKWRSQFELQRIRVEAELDAKKPPRRSP